MESMILIITNGDSAAEVIKNAGIKAEILPWRDVLHDGPVPACLTLEELANIRGRFVSAWGWGDFDSVLKIFLNQYSKISHYFEFDEILLWFEHDLFDQLQLIQILHFFSHQELKSTKLTLICKDRFVSSSAIEQIQFDFSRRRTITPAQIELGAEAWQAFTSENPTNLENLVQKNLRALRFLKAAIRRLLEEFPDPQNGLSRNERQILELVKSGIRHPTELFKASQKLENPVYLGDWSFFRYVGQLVNCKRPLLKTATDGLFLFPPKSGENEFLRQSLSVTGLGRSVLANQDDWIELNGIDKWIGGVHLTKDYCRRWDRHGERLTGSNFKTGRD